MQAITDLTAFLALESPNYIVKEEDSLESISRKTGVSVKTLRNINKLFDNRDVQTGQVIRLHVPRPDKEEGIETVAGTEIDSGGEAKAVVGASIGAPPEYMSPGSDSVGGAKRSFFSLPKFMTGDSSSSSSLLRDSSSGSLENCVHRAAMASAEDSSSFYMRDIGGVYIEGGECQILNEKKMTLVHAYLPVLHQCEPWVLLYSLYEHGADFGTFYNKVEGYQKTLIVVRLHCM